MRSNATSGLATRTHAPTTPTSSEASECKTRPARCDLSHGIVANDAANTVAFHLVTPDPELLDRLAVWDAVAVPPGAPNHDVGSRPLPATGAYYAASVTPREVRFVRNPHFHEWSRAARPDGYPDQIIARFGTSPSAELTDVERGSADYTLDGPPPGRVNELETRFPSQLHINPDVVLDEHRAQYAHPAVHRRQGPAGAELRRRPRHGREARGLSGAAVMPVPDALHPGVQALLPVHTSPEQRRSLASTRHGQGTAPDLSITHAWDADHHLEPGTPRRRDCDRPVRRLPAGSTRISDARREISRPTRRPRDGLPTLAPKRSSP